MNAMETIAQYFRAERAESVLFILVGALGLLLSWWFVVSLKRPFFTGMAISITAVALLQLIVGTTVFVRSPQDTARVTGLVQSDRPRLQSEEVPRMRVVMRNFKIYLGAEVGLLVLGLVVLAIGSAGSIWSGAAAGLAGQALFTMVLDLTAMRRGGKYLEWLLSVH